MERGCDEAEIICIGTLYRGQWEKKFWNSSRARIRFPLPVGYTAKRLYHGHNYLMEICEGRRGPLFQVTSGDGFAASGDTATAAWTSILNLRGGSAKGSLLRVDGLELFGFKHQSVQLLLQDLVSCRGGAAVQSTSDVALVEVGADHMNLDDCPPATENDFCQVSTTDEENVNEGLLPSAQSVERMNLSLNGGGMNCGHQQLACYHSRKRKRTALLASGQQKSEEPRYNMVDSFTAAGKKFSVVQPQIADSVTAGVRVRTILPFTGGQSSLENSGSGRALQESAALGTSITKGQATSTLKDLLISECGASSTPLISSSHGDIFQRSRSRPVPTKRSWIEVAPSRINQFGVATILPSDSLVDLETDTDNEDTQDPDRIVVQSISPSSQSELSEVTHDMLAILLPQALPLLRRGRQRPNSETGNPGCHLQIASRTQQQENVCPLTYEETLAEGLHKLEASHVFSSAATLVRNPGQSSSPGLPTISGELHHVCDGPEAGKQVDSSIDTEIGSDKEPERILRTRIPAEAHSSVSTIHRALSKKETLALSVEPTSKEEPYLEDCIRIGGGVAIPGSPKTKGLRELGDAIVHNGKAPSLEYGQDQGNDVSYSEVLYSTQEMLDVAAGLKSSDSQDSLMLKIDGQCSGQDVVQSSFYSNERRGNHSGEDPSVTGQLIFPDTSSHPIEEFCESAAQGCNQGEYSAAPKIMHEPYPPVSMGHISHPFPVLYMLLSAFQETIQLCVCCAAAEERLRTLFTYRTKQAGNGDMEFCLQTCFTISVQLQVESSYEFEDQGLVFLPNGQGLVMLDKFCITNERYESQSSNKSPGVQILAFEKKDVLLQARLSCPTALHCLAIPDTQLVISAGAGGRVNCYKMDYCFKSCQETFALPLTSTETKFSIIRQLLRVPGHQHIIIGCDGVGNFAIWDYHVRVLLTTFCFKNFSFLKAHLLCSIPPATQGAIQHNRTKSSGRVSEGLHQSTAGQNLDNGCHFCDGRMDLCFLVWTRSPNHEEAISIQPGRSVSARVTCRYAVTRGSRSNDVLTSSSFLDDRVSAASGTGMYAVLGTIEGEAHVVDTLTGRKIVGYRDVQGACITSVVVDPASGIFAIASEEGKVILYGRLNPNTTMPANSSLL